MSIDWAKVQRVLIVRLRSIGDTVLATPSLIALRRFLPDARIDILLEDWVAPVLSGHEAASNVLAIGTQAADRLRTALMLRRQSYDLAVNLHGGTTATFLTAATRARHRVGYANYRYSFLYNHLLTSSAEFWGREGTHSAEQQLALLGSVGVPVEDKPKSRLTLSEEADRRIGIRLAKAAPGETDLAFALMHPTTAFYTKQWPVENYACTAEILAERGLHTVAIASRPEAATLHELVEKVSVPVTIYDDLTLPEITALSARARLFVGNDSGMAHIAAAVGTPTVVVFGSSNRDHWRPWTDSPHEVVFEEYDCQPCPGYTCAVFGDPKCIRSISPAKVVAAVERILDSKSENTPS